MKFSELAKRLYEESEFTSISSLSDTLDLNKGFVDRCFAGKNTTEKIDILFDELTKELTAEDFLLMKELITRIKQSKIEQEQIL